MAIALVLLPLAHSFLVFVISASLIRPRVRHSQAATMAFLIDRVQLKKRGLAVSTYSTGFDADLSIGAILMGVVSQHWGFAAMWLLAATITLLDLAGLLADRCRGIFTAQ